MCPPSATWDDSTVDNAPVSGLLADVAIAGGRHGSAGGDVVLTAASVDDGFHINEPFGKLSPAAAAAVGGDPTPLAEAGDELNGSCVAPLESEESAGGSLSLGLNATGL